MGSEWIVTRDCCTSGNCNICGCLSEYGYKTPYGVPRRIEHSRYRDRSVAEQVAKGWQTYNPTIEEVR